jgi:hypothetical protein
LVLIASQSLRRRKVLSIGFRFLTRPTPDASAVNTRVKQEVSK